MTDERKQNMTVVFYDKDNNIIGDVYVSASDTVDAREIALNMADKFDPMIRENSKSSFVVFDRS